MSRNINLQLRKGWSEIKSIHPCPWRGAFVTRQYYSDNQFNKDLPDIIMDGIRCQTHENELHIYDDIDVEITIKVKKANGR